MATIRQKKLAHALIDNLQAEKPLNKQELVVSVGYSEQSGEKKATEIIQSKGTQEELKSLGFTEENAKRVLTEIMDKDYAEDRDRIRAAEVTLKTLGAMAPERHINLNVQSKLISLDE